MNICEFEKCTGCAACKSICPAECIEMRSDGEGFLRPRIDSTRCLKCGKCRKTCPAVNNIKFRTPTAVYAAWCKNDAIHNSSASGGLATVFANKTVVLGGTVSGARSEFSNNTLRISHVTESTKDGVLAFQGSKYLQSDTSEIFPEIKIVLESGKRVLFCGTPCQVAGLYAFLQHDYENLVTVDIVCHGVPSRELLNRHIREICGGKENPTQISAISFRNGNRICLTLFNAEGQTVYSEGAPSDKYITGFLSGLFYRPCCYRCNYAQKKRCSDITLGDFWGLGKNIPFNERVTNGISLCMVNTPKGADLFESVSDDIEFRIRTLDEAVNGNDQLRNPSREKFCNRRKFFRELKKHGNFGRAVKKSAWLAEFKYAIINLLK